MCATGFPRRRSARRAAGAGRRGEPAPGDWLYFVTIDMQGTTLFTRDYNSTWPTSNWPGTTVSSTARDDQRRCARGRGPRCWARRSRTRGRRSCTSPPTARSGLADWTYERIECTAEQLPALVSGFGPEWVGLSVTMPGKFAALRVRRRAHRARRAGRFGQHPGPDGVGLAGRQHRRRRGDGRARQRAQRRSTGAGGPRRRRHGARRGRRAGRARRATTSSIVARNRGQGRTAARPRRRGSASTTRCGRQLGARRRGRRRRSWSAPFRPTSPRGTRDTGRQVPVLLDAIYDPWPTPLAAAVAAAGGRVVSGLQMLLNQAFAQVEQFTGLPAPERGDDRGARRDPRLASDGGRGRPWAALCAWPGWWRSASTTSGSGGCRTR